MSTTYTTRWQIALSDTPPEPDGSGVNWFPFGVGAGGVVVWRRPHPDDAAKPKPKKGNTSGKSATPKVNLDAGL